MLRYLLEFGYQARSPEAWLPGWSLSFQGMTSPERQFEALSLGPGTFEKAKQNKNPM